MNTKRMGVFLFVITTLLTIGGCTDKVKDTVTYTANVPVYQTRTEFIKSVKTESKLDLIQPGKIFLKGNFIFVNELYKGIHVIDNSNPSSPVNSAFISIPGNVDIAVRGNTLYADSYTDLVSLDITDPTKATETARFTNAFPNVMPPTGNSYPIAQIDTSKGVIVGWKQQRVTEDVNKPNYYIGPMFSAADDNGSWAYASTNGTGTTSQAAIAGSLTSFAIYGDNLYALSNSQIKTFSITGAPALTNNTYTSWQAETLFISGNLMFAGTKSGLMIYSLNDPNMPTQISSFSHLYSCDPVVVEGTRAYYTMRSGNNCGQSISGMGVIDISDPTKPVELSFFALSSPNGLGIDNNRLFVCDGDKGLKVFDATDPLKLLDNQIATFNSVQAVDVIPYNNILILIGQTGLKQYDYTDIHNIKLLSTIPITAFFAD
jgi:hypothetical protein